MWCRLFMMAFIISSFVHSTGIDFSKKPEYKSLLKAFIENKIFLALDNKVVYPYGQFNDDCYEPIIHVAMRLCNLYKVCKADTDIYKPCDLAMIKTFNRLISAESIMHLELSIERKAIDEIINLLNIRVRQ